MRKSLRNRLLECNPYMLAAAAGTVVVLLLILVTVLNPGPGSSGEASEPDTVTFHGAPPGGETRVYRSVDCDTGVVVYLSENGDIALVPASMTWLGDVAERCAAGQGLSQ